MSNTVKQNFTSAATSINSTKLPAVYGKVKFSGDEIILDYGCGKFTDHIKKAVGNAIYLPYDKYNQPADVNRNSLDSVKAAIAAGAPVTVVCSNVLNVIDSEDVIQGITDQITNIVKSSGGVGYITVYEGNGSGSGRQTGADSWQRCEKLREYLRFFDADAEVKCGMIIVH